MQSFHVRYFPFLFDLLVIVSSVFFGYVFLFFAFRGLPCDFHVSSLVPLGPFQSPLHSTALLWTPLGLPVSYLPLSSPGHLCSMFYFPCRVYWWVLILFRCSCPRRQYAYAYCPFCLCLSLLLLLVAALVMA